MESTRFVGLSKAAEILGVSHRTLLNWISGGIIPAYRINAAGKFLIVLSEAEEAIKRHAAQRSAPLTKERAQAIIDDVMSRSRARMAAKKAKATILRQGETVH